jgi:exopolysaccharide production protein ExoQ
VSDYAGSAPSTRTLEKEYRASQAAKNPVADGRSLRQNRRAVAKEKSLLSVIEGVFVVVALFLYSGALAQLLLSGNEAVADLDQTDGNPVMQVMWLGLYVGTSLLIALRWRTVLRVAMREPALWALVALALASVLWSADPALTMRRDFALVGTTLFGLYLAVRYPLRDQLRLFAWALGGAAVLSLLFAVALPAYGVTEIGWRGVFVHKNLLGRAMTLTAMVFWLLPVIRPYSHWLRRAGFAVAVGLILLSGSKTALIILSTLLVVLGLRRLLQAHFALAIPFVVAVTAIAAYVATLVASTLEVIFGVLGKDPSLTGRTDLWAVLVEAAGQRPWLGYGYGAFWQGLQGPSARVWLVEQWGPTHAHNGFLDMWLALGLVGLALWILLLGRFLLRAVRWMRMTKTAEGMWPLLYCIFILINSFPESTMMDHNDLQWVVLVATSLTIASRPAPAARTSQPGMHIEEEPTLRERRSRKPIGAL